MQDILMDRFVQWITGEVSEFVPISKPNLPPKPVIKKVQVDSDEELANLTQKQLKLHVAKAVKKAVKSHHRCSICNKTGHNRNCLKNKKKSRSKNKSKKKGKVNIATVDSSSESGSDSNTSNNESDSGSESGSDSGESSVESESKSDVKVHITKERDGNPSKPCKENQKETSTSSKFQNKSTILEQNIRRILLDMLEKVLLPYQLEKLKPENKNLTIPDFINHRELVPKISESDGEENIIDNPMEIDFVCRKEPATDVATAKCKIKRLIIPGAGLDSCANFPVMTEDIAKRAKLLIDTKEKHDLSGVATTPTESIGTVRNVPVTFAPGCTIYSDFAVVRHPKPMLILPNTLLNKYDYDLLASKRELKLICNGKEFFIPINMHKVKNKLEVNYMTIVQDGKSSVPDQISQEADSDDPSLKKNA
ncbi:hypothetical protein C2G38_2200862 [Gigaspora rosea]|uniref:CCHC-type domain-containing protein n=1 Tax=Gigaspora rosea TaxID=44941 RepID=A0A397UXV9_9GLOM|nr:hypothetical protein C2G38_2200862 [Gigaspora rosea]